MVAGGGGFVCDYLTLFLLYQYAGLHYLLASGCAFVVGVIFVYIVSNKWVFETRKLGGQGRRIRNYLDTGTMLYIDH